MGEDLFSTRGMVRRNDQRTSIAAAQGIAPHVPTIRQLVLNFAAQAGLGGFIADDMVKAMPEQRETSLRKRLGELHERNLVIDSGRTRTNRYGNAEIVWLHRDCAANPPPVREPEPEQVAARRPSVPPDEIEQAIADMKSAERQMRAEGRAMFAGKLAGWIELVGKLTR